MRFVEALDKFDTNSEKACVWILIELHNKNLLNVFNEILKNPQIMHFYSSSSTIKSNRSEIRDILTKLGRLSYNIESKFLQGYEKNKDTFEQEDSEEEEATFERGNPMHSSAVNTTNTNDSNANINMTQSESSLKRSRTNMDAVKQNLERYKTLVKKSTIHGRDDDDSHTYVREDYKTDFGEQETKNPFVFITKVIQPVTAIKDVFQRPVHNKSLYLC